MTRRRDIRFFDWRETMKAFGPVSVVLLAVGIFGAPGESRAAGKYDGSVPLLCAPTVVTECGPDGDCQRRTAASVNLPQFMKIDLKAMKVSSEETGRDSPIRNVEHQDGSLIIQGGQNGRGWTMTVSEDSGSMSAAITAAGEGFVIFGAYVVP
jgi:hypothetical protein